MAWGCGGEASSGGGSESGDESTGDDEIVEESSSGDTGESGDGESGSTGASLVDPPWPIPPRNETRTCRFGAASDGPWVGAGRPADTGERAPDVPDRLSDAHCFADLPGLVPGPDLAPYEINAPLWTDGAHKHRFIVLPPGRAIEVEPDGVFEFPPGAAILKVFALERTLGDPESAVPVETRVMIRRADGWEFHTYRWDDDGLDASWVPGGDVITVEQRDGEDAVELPYYFPSQDTCRSCHRPGDAHEVLGPRTEQLGRWRHDDAGDHNQLAALADAGWIEGTTAEALAASPTFVDPADETAPIEDRARSYLHANCSHCHREGGWQPVDMTMDLRASTPLSETEICDVPLQYWSPWAGGTKRIAPGDPADSNMLQRMMIRGDGQMPLVASYRVDPLGVEVMKAWIESLEGCPAP